MLCSAQTRAARLVTSFCVSHKSINRPPSLFRNTADVLKSQVRRKHDEVFHQGRDKLREDLIDC